MIKIRFIPESPEQSIRKYRKICLSLSLFILGLIIILYGVAANFTAVTKNNGKMPVKDIYLSYETDTHFSYLEDSEIKNPKLSDKYRLNLPNYRYIMYSIGDVLLTLGASICIFSVIYLNWVVYRKGDKWHT